MNLTEIGLREHVASSRIMTEALVGIRLSEKQIASRRCGSATEQLFINPSRDEIESIFSESSPCRGLYDLKTRDVYVWLGVNCLHKQMMSQMGLEEGIVRFQLHSDYKILFHESFDVAYEFSKVRPEEFVSIRDQAEMNRKESSLQEAVIFDVNMFVKNELLKKLKSLRRKGDP